METFNAATAGPGSASDHLALAWAGAWLIPHPASV
jgi:hypothetical protein